MTADAQPWTSPQLGQQGVSRRTSRTFLSLFSSKSSKRQQKPSSPHAMTTNHPGQPSPQARFDAISLTSSYRDDPAFSLDPATHYAHPVVRANPRTARNSAPPLSAPPLSAPPLSAPDPIQRDSIQRDSTSSLAPASMALSQRMLRPQDPGPTALYPHQQRRAPSGPYYASNDQSMTSFASQSSLLTSVNDSFAPSPYSSSPSLILSTGPEPSETGEEPSPIPPANSTNPDDRALSPPPDYEPFPSPRPTALRIESSPELRRIDPPGLPLRPASTSVLLPPAAPRRPNDRRPQPYDLDRIDELDETSPLGVSLHHEGPFQAISAALKGPSPLGNQSIPQKMRPSRAHKSDNVAGGSGFSIVPGQVVPRIFQQYYQPGSYMQNYQQDSSHPSTSYLPPQPPYGLGSTMVPPVAQRRPNHDPRRPPEGQFYDQRIPIPPQQSYPNPYDVNSNAEQYIRHPQIPSQDPYYSASFSEQPGHHSRHTTTEDNSDAYGGIEEEPKRDRSSVPQAPFVQSEPQNDDGALPRRHSAQPGFNPPVDPRVMQQVERFRQLHMSDVPSNPSQLVPEGYSQYDPQYPAETAPLQRHAPSDEHDRWRPASLPPGAATSTVLAQRPVSHQPSHFPHDAVAPLGGQQQLGRSPYQQQQVLQGPDPRRRQSAQAHPPPVDLRQQELQMVNDLRQPNSPPSFEPSISSVNPRRPQPQHVPKHLVMPTPLQQNPRSSQQQPHAQAYRASPPPVQHYAPTPQVKSQALPSQPVRAQTIQMAPEGGRQVLRKRASVVKAPSLPMPPPTRPGATRPLSYMEPPPTVPQTPIPQPTVQNKRRPKRLLSKKRTDL